MPGWEDELAVPVVASEEPFVEAFEARLAPRPSVSETEPIGDPAGEDPAEGLVEACEGGAGG